MFNFFSRSDNRQGDKYIIEGADYNHIKNVLRMDIGDKCLISADGKSDFFLVLMIGKIDFVSHLLSFTPLFFPVMRYFSDFAFFSRSNFS